MEPLGVMIYGYGAKDAAIVKDILQRLTGRDIKVLSGSGQETDTVRGVLELGEEAGFQEADHKVMMFLNLDDEQIGQVLSGFPRKGYPERPIFCGVTPDNLHWTLKNLVEHLLEERRRFQQAEAAETDGTPPARGQS